MLTFLEVEAENMSKRRVANKEDFDGEVLDEEVKPNLEVPKF